MKRAIAALTLPVSIIVGSSHVGAQPRFPVGCGAVSENSDEIEHLIRERSWRQALSAIDAEVERLIAAESEDERAWSRLFALRALANAEAGDQAEATWDWDVAAQAGADAAAGAVGRIAVPSTRLDRIRSQRDPWREPTNARTGTKERSTLPSVLEKAQLLFPREFSSGCGHFIVQVSIDSRGYPTRGRLLKRPRVGAVNIVILNAIREWRFAPATSKGTPVESDYVLTVHIDCW